jgi:signal transduction histidine kinase
MAVVSATTLTVAIRHIHEENRTEVTRAAVDMEERLAIILSEIETRVRIAAAVIIDIPPNSVPTMLRDVSMPRLDALYTINADGKVTAVYLDNGNQARSQELIGIDLSTYPLYVQAKKQIGVIWSDKQISAVTGNVTMAIATPLKFGAGVAIAEVSTDSIIEITKIARGSGSLDYWIIDKNGEIVADTGPDPVRFQNLYYLPIVKAALEGKPPPEEMEFRGEAYSVAANRSDKLGWLVISRIPDGLSNPRIVDLVRIIASFVLGVAVVGLVLASAWVRSVVRPLHAVADSATRIAKNNPPTKWPSATIVEIDQLYRDLQAMSEAITGREADLQKLNSELEARVQQRTEALQRSNVELSRTLVSLELAKDELVQSEKHAALGRLVAGVAHELATPLGNGRIAISTLNDRLVAFRRRMADGLRKSDLEGFVETTDASISIAEANLHRASDLIKTFKQVAADRTASRRRSFKLNEVMDEVILTMTPTIKRYPVTITSDIPEGILMDSFPGELGQVITNLIENTLLHAFPDKAPGIVTITGKQLPEERVEIRFSDNGVGMTGETARKIFDPFYTTQFGHGGTGLGLSITQGAVNNVLGGSITVESEKGKGTTFIIELPLDAPRDDPGEGASE